MYRFSHLPIFAQFVLDHHLDAYVNEQIRLSYELNVPVLRYLAHLTPEQLFAQSKEGNIELLQTLAANRAKDFLEISMQRWLSNQLPMINKFQILAEDITLINYVRQESLKKLIPLYTTDLTTALAIGQELDRFILGSNTTASNTYIELLKSQIEEETHFSNNVIQASPAITYIFDLRKQKSVYVSGKVMEVMGYSPDEVRQLGGNLVQQLGHPDDLAVINAGLQQMMAENSNRTFMAEFRLRDKNSNYHWLRSYLVVFNRDEEGRPVEVLGQIYEVSKEKELVQAVEQREKQLLEAQSIARLGSYDWSFETDRTEYTPELRNIFETEEPQGYEQMLQRVHPDDQERLKHCMKEAMKTGLYECEYRYIIHGKEKVLWARGIVVYEGDQPKRMIGTVQDITDRKRIEDSLVEKTIALQKSNANLQEFASVASHDLKEPLRKIITFSDLLIAADGQQLSPQGNLYLQKIVDSATRMKALIEDILAYSSLSGDERKEKVSLYRLVQDVLSTLEVPIKEKKAKVVISNLPEAPVFPLQITQLFQNLLSNSLKFFKEGVPLTIRISHDYKKPSQINGYAVHKAPRYLQIDIADNGIGFNNEAAEKIFGLFSRLHSKTQFEGTGLGLAICRKVAENHGGVIYAHSRPGEGAVFTLLLPVES
jgi:hypothetical protein